MNGFACPWRHFKKKLSSRCPTERRCNSTDYIVLATMISAAKMMPLSAVAGRPTFDATDWAKWPDLAAHVILRRQVHGRGIFRASRRRRCDASYRNRMACHATQKAKEHILVDIALSNMRRHAVVGSLEVTSARLIDGRARWRRVGAFTGCTLNDRYLQAKARDLTTALIARYFSMARRLLLSGFGRVLPGSTCQSDRHARALHCWA